MQLYKSIIDITIHISALLAVCTDERRKPRLIEITAGCSLIAPSSVHWEIGNALSTMLKRDRVDLAQAQACVAAYREVPLRLLDVDLVQALAIATRFRMYAYDAYLLTCAMQSRSPLLSLDGALNKVAGELGILVLGESP